MPTLETNEARIPAIGSRIRVKPGHSRRGWKGIVTGHVPPIRTRVLLDGESQDLEFKSAHLDVTFWAPERPGEAEEPFTAQAVRQKLDAEFATRLEALEREGTRLGRRMERLELLMGGPSVETVLGAITNRNEVQRLCTALATGLGPNQAGGEKPFCHNCDHHWTPAGEGRICGITQNPPPESGLCDTGRWKQARSLQEKLDEIHNHYGVPRTRAPEPPGATKPNPVTLWGESREDVERTVARIRELCTDHVSLLRAFEFLVDQQPKED